MIVLRTTDGATDKHTFQMEKLKMELLQIYRINFK